jgi:hypothetical protein
MSIWDHDPFRLRVDLIEHEPCQQAEPRLRQQPSEQSCGSLTDACLNSRSPVPHLTIDATGALRLAYRNLLFFRYKHPEIISSATCE